MKANSEKANEKRESIVYFMTVGHRMSAYCVDVCDACNKTLKRHLK